MKTRIITVLVTFLAIGAGPSIWAASAPEAAEKVASKMLKTKEAMDATSAQIDATLNSMNALTSAKGSEIIDSYSDFSKNVDKLGSMAKKAKSNADKARKDRDAYLKKWESTQGKIQNEQLKEASKARRDELLPKIDAVKDASASMKEAFPPFLQSLKDLQLYLGNDLSERGLSTASSLMSQCSTDGEKLKSDMATVVANYQQLAAALNPSMAK
jgi:hypothetical protein